MPSKSPTFYWDHSSKRWVYCKTETKSHAKRRAPARVRIDKLVDELVSACPSLELLIEYIKGISEETPTESRTIQGEFNDSFITRERLYEICTLRAISLGLKYSKRYNADIEDTIQNALLGASIAIDTYREGPLIGHLYHSMREEVLTGIPIGEHVCCVPWKMKLSIYNILQKNEIECSELLLSQNCFEQASEAIQSMLHCGRQAANNLVTLWMEPLSIDTLIETEDFSLSDMGIGDEKLIDRVYQAQTKYIIVQAIDKLKTDKEKEVIRARFGFVGETMSLDEISKQFGVTRERIRQIEKKALDQIYLWSRQLYLVADIDNRGPKAYKNKMKEAATISTKKDSIKREVVEIHTEFGARTIVFEY